MEVCPTMGGEIIPTILTVEELSKIALPPACTAGTYIVKMGAKALTALEELPHIN